MITAADKLLLASGAQSNALGNPYLEFVSSTAMTITPKYTNSGVTLQYSLDGTSWTDIASEATTPSANIIYFRGQATGTKSLFTTSNSTNAWAFNGTTNLECNGKLDRLIQNALGNNDDILTLDNYCFDDLFYSISALISVDNDCLPATTLASNCYSNMFRGCTGLTTAPALPATTLASSCYAYMFRGCTGLTKAPALPATTLDTNCYSNMFYGCTRLITAPALPALTLQTNCYAYMFYGCTRLIKAPALPATTLAASCYTYMFGGCTGLITLPILSGLILQTSCYQGMFLGCTKIKISTTLTGIYDTAYRIPKIGTGTTATNALSSMFAGTGGTFNGTPTINTTYYTENTPV